MRCMALTATPTRSSMGCTASRGSGRRGCRGGYVAALQGEPVEDELLPAVLHTITMLGLDPADSTTFLSSMSMDLHVCEYDDPALLSYMEGSAAVIGTMMLPILDPADPMAAREPARQLRLAFSADPGYPRRRRGRGPQSRLPAAGRSGPVRGQPDRPAPSGRGWAVRPGGARADRLRGRPSPRPLRRRRARGRDAAPTSQACIRTAHHLYAGSSTRSNGPATSCSPAAP
jgi:phytoene synthase